jgi:hypothetical protein
MAHLFLARSTRSLSTTFRPIHSSLKKYIFEFSREPRRLTPRFYCVRGVGEMTPRPTSGEEGPAPPAGELDKVRGARHAAPPPACSGKGSDSSVIYSP